MDAISLLQKDHREVEALFKRFERLGRGNRAQKGRVVDRIIDALARHAAIEEMFLYPAVRERIHSKEALALESLEEHHVVKWLLYELDRLRPSDERYDAKLCVLAENMRLHVKKEERELFPALRRSLSTQELTDLGVLMAEMKKAAPTRPHPRAPDTPPGNLFAGTIAGLLDRGRDLLRGELRAPRPMAARTSRSGGRKKAKK
ncbi:MAG: hemerythrin domain-containing protein [Myxococcaceae bacterium]|nr:hemerythrin domain-containing protein [Myxococcaceae bacterium]